MVTNYNVDGIVAFVDNVTPVYHNPKIVAN